MTDPGGENGNRLYELLQRTLNAEQVLPPENDALAELATAVAELGEILAEAHHQAVAFGLIPARELGALRERFIQLQANFLNHVRQRAICGNRLVLGFCGGFSAGKSTFLNLLLTEKKEDSPLPTKATRDTALPVFLLSSGKDERVWIENHQGRGYLDGTIHDLALFRHSEGTSFEPWSYLVRSLYLLAPWIKYSEVAYLDLPGHTAGPEDLRLSLAAARQCDAIVYLIDVTQGDLKETDVAFLRELSGLHPPFLILLTKCDLRSPKQVAQMQAKIASSLQQQEIPHEGPYQWSKDPELVGQHRLGFKAVREYGAKLARTNKDQRFGELAEIAAKLAAVCADNVHQLRRRRIEHLDQLKELTATPLADSVFDKAKAIAQGSRSVGSFVSESFFTKDFQSDDFRKYHYSHANEWLEASQQGFSGNLNALTLWGMYATVLDAIDQSAWWASHLKASPSASSDQWYYEHLQRLRTVYQAVTAKLDEIANAYTRASQLSIDAVRTVSERAEAVKKRLGEAYWSVKKTAAMG